MDVMDFTQIDEDVHLRNLQPDGLVMDDDRKRIHILEVTRTSDLMTAQSSLERARQTNRLSTTISAKKLANLFPDYLVSVQEFIIGIQKTRPHKHSESMESASSKVSEQK